MVIGPLGDRIKHTNIYIIVFPPRRRKERESGPENLLERITAGNFPNLGKERDILVQEAQRAPKKMNPRRFKPI